MAAVCRNAKCSQDGVEKWDGMIPAGEVIVCGECGKPVKRNRTVLPAPWEQVTPDGG